LAIQIIAIYMHFMQDTARSGFGFRLVTLARQWRHALDRELARAGLSDASWAPLIHLAAGGDNISQTELAERVGVDGSSLVRLIDLLEQRGLIARRIDPSDRRARRIVLSDAGRAEVAQIRQRVFDIEAQLLADLDEQDLARMLDSFSQIESRLRAVRSAPRGNG
jgi:MarR family transcriptional regulator for hemolysin